MPMYSGTPVQKGYVVNDLVDIRYQLGAQDKLHF